MLYSMLQNNQAEKVPDKKITTKHQTKWQTARLGGGDQHRSPEPGTRQKQARAHQQCLGKSAGGRDPQWYRPVLTTLPPLRLDGKWRRIACCVHIGGQTNK